MSLFATEISAFKKLREDLRRNDAFYGKLLVAAAVGVLSLLIVSLAFLFLLWMDHRMETERSRALDVVRAASEVEVALSEVERVHRACVFTEQAPYLDTFERSANLLESRIEDLQRAVHDQHDLVKRADDLAAKAKDWVQNQARPIMRRIADDLAAESAPSSAPQPTQSPPESATSPEPPRVRVRKNSADTAILADCAATLQAIQKDALVRVLDKNRDDVFARTSFQILVAMPRLKSIVADMERAEWSWLLTGDKKWADLNRNAVFYFNSFFGHLSVLIGGNEEQAQRLNEIRARVDAWQREIAGPGFANRPAQADLMMALAAGRSRAAMNELRTTIAEFERAQASIYDRAQARTEFSRNLRAGLLGGLSFVGMCAMLWSAWYSFRAYRRSFGKVRNVENQTRSILDNAPDGIVTFNGQGAMQSINPAAEKMFGVRAHEITGKNISKLIPQIRIAELVTKCGTAVTTTAVRQGVYTFPIEISLGKMDSEHGPHFVALIRDTSERRRSEETLRQIGVGISSATGEEFLRNLAKQLSKALGTDFAFVVEIARGTVPVSASLILADRGQVRAIPRYQLAGSFGEEVLRKGTIMLVEDAQKAHPGDQLLRDLGVYSYVVTPLVDHRGKAAGLMGIMHRSTLDRSDLAESTLQIFAARAAAEIERKRFAEDLAAEKERLAITLRSIGDGFIATDMDGRILLMNAIAEKLTGWALDQAGGKPLTEVFRLYNEKTRTFAENAVQRIIETGSAVGIASSASIVAKDGQQRTIETTASPIRDKGNRKIGVVLVFKDVTEKLRLEDEHRKAEKLESLGVAAGGIAHDFNNLLTAIIGNLSLALMDLDENDALHDRVTTAKKASLRAQDLAQQLLTFAKGGTPIKKTASVGQMLQDTVKFSLRGSNIRSEFDIPPDLWACEVDTGQISQVITNLTVNAEQAMPAGGTLRIICRNFEATAENMGGQPLRAGRYVRISVQDEGIGIPEEYIQKIFDPYFTTKPKGSGLGLATAYSIIKNHEGLITVNSSAGEGTAFHIFLPASDKAAPPSIEDRMSLPAISAEALARSRPNRGRVLVLDDEKVICALVSASLQPLGYEVVEAYDATTAIRLYDEAMRAGKRFDVVITDLTIPGGMGGLEATKILRDMDPDVKAIVSSGYATDPVMSRYREYGFAGCIAKPYEVSALGKIVDEVIAMQTNGEVYHDLVQAHLD